MRIDQLGAEVVKLDPRIRARLAQKLIASLEELSEAESTLLWAEEAARRNAEWDQSGALGTPAQDVFRGARARLG